jgi:hypothetical protein
MSAPASNDIAHLFSTLLKLQTVAQTMHTATVGLPATTDPDQTLARESTTSLLEYLRKSLQNYATFLQRFKMEDHPGSDTYSRRYFFVDANFVNIYDSLRRMCSHPLMNTEDRATLAATLGDGLH